jgi:thymidylate kinase
MPGGKSSVEAMEQMIRQLTQLQQIQEDMQQKVRQTYENIGSEWDDQQYVNMEQEIDEIVQALSSCCTSLSSSTTKLQVRKRMLEDYLSFR